jgi:lysyl-tRNA synthetase class 2
MLEWYRGFAGLELIEADLRALLQTLAEEGWIDGGAKTVTETDFATLFRRHFDFELKPSTDATELAGLCSRLAVHTTPDDSFNDLFHRLLVDRLEAEIAALGPALVKRFPPSQAALAKLDADGWADRFEFYWGGLEIANAFNEVNDPDEQSRRWTGEQQERARLGTSAVPQDPELIRALRRGMPPTGGIALGLERLYMACARVTDIRELRLFSAAELFTSENPAEGPTAG